MIGLLTFACSTQPGTDPLVEGPAAAPVSQTLAAPVEPERSTPSPYAVPAGPDLQRAVAELERVVETWGANSQDGWAIAHALMARGPDLVLDNGEPAVQWLFSEFAQVRELDGERLIGFPRESEGRRVEPHTDLVLKVLTEIGVSPSTMVEVDGEAFSVADLWRHSVLTTWMKKNGDASYLGPNDMPWGMQGIAAWADPSMTWTAWEGTPMDLDALGRLLSFIVFKESSDQLNAMQQGQPLVKKGQGLFQYTCGGAHLVQGATYVAARGAGGEQALQVARTYGALWLWRFPQELALYQDAVVQHPEKRLVLRAQQLKFVGHWLETMHKLAAMGLWEADAAGQLALAEALGVLVDTVKDLKALGALDNLDAIRAENEQLYLDLVGDSAHALRGVSLATGAGTVRW